MNYSKIEIDFEKLFQLAQKNQEIELLENNLFTLYLLNRNNYDIRRFFHNRQLSTDQKMKLFENSFGQPTSKLFYHLLYLIIDKKLYHKIYYIYEGFSKIVNRKDNRIIIQIYTAIPLSTLILQNIKPRLETLFQKKITLKNFIDAGLLGGMYLKLPNGKIFDFTYKSMLLSLKFHLMEK